MSDAPAPAQARATPDRYEISRRGTPDPDGSRYVVLDVVHDWSARVAMRRLVRLYEIQGALTHAQDLERFLDATEPAAVELIVARRPVAQKRTSRPSRRRR